MEKTVIEFYRKFHLIFDQVLKIFIDTIFYIRGRRSPKFTSENFLKGFFVQFIIMVNLHIPTQRYSQQDTDKNTVFTYE